MAIARALYADPAIILADEPTASLDSEKVEEVGKLFKTLAKQKEKAIILVTHDLRLNKYSDKIYEMLDGRLSLKKDKQKHVGMKFCTYVFYFNSTN